MKRKKALLALALSGVMAVSVFAGCGSDNKKDIAPAAETTAESTEEPAAEEAEEAEEEVVEDTKAVSESAEEEAEEETKEETEEEEAPAGDLATIEETVLADTNDIVITAKSLAYDEYYGAVLKVLIENNSDKDINVDLGNLVVNDFAVNGWIFEDVTAGKKSNAEVEIDYDTLQEMGLSNIGKIEISFDICEAQTYESIVWTDVVTIETSQFAEMDTTIDVDDGYEMYNENGIRIVGQYLDEGDEYSYSSDIVLYVENNTDKNITINAEDVSINGFMLDYAYMYCGVPAGKKAVPSVSINKDELEDNDIETIEDVELKFDIRESETYDSIARTDAIKMVVS